MKLHCHAWSVIMANLKSIFDSDDPAKKSELFKILKDAQSVRSRLPEKESLSKKPR